MTSVMISPACKSRPAMITRSDFTPVVRTIVEAAPAAIDTMVAQGVAFDREGESFMLGKEGGHSHRRIIHAADATGRAISEVLSERAMAAMGQEVMQPPNVKGWDGGEKWINTATLFNRYNFVAGLVHGSGRDRGRPRPRASRPAGRAAAGPCATPQRR